MKILSQEAFQRAKSYIKRDGRELDRRLFEFHFEGGSKEAVLAELSNYQNEDGGFGRALEPDLRTTASSAIATAQGFTILREVGATAEDMPVQRAIDYLMSSYDAERKVWPIIPPEADDAPHAFWWDYGESEQNFGGFLINPRAALVGHLHHFARLVLGDFLADITATLLDYLETMPDEMNMFELLSCLGLAEADNLPEKQRATVLKRIYHAAPLIVERDRQKWSEYCLRPVDVVPEPGALLAKLFSRDELEANLDYEIDQQNEEGAWPIPWSWEAADAVAWKEAEREWKGHHAVINLRRLRAYGRF